MALYVCRPNARKITANRKAVEMMTHGPDNFIKRFLVLMTEVCVQPGAAVHFQRQLIESQKGYIVKISYIYLVCTVKRWMVMSL